MTGGHSSNHWLNQLVTLLVVLLIGMVARGQSPATLEEKYLLRQPGALPIILSAPHGGRVALPDVPARLGEGVEKFVVVTDSGTLELIQQLAQQIEKEFGAKPYLVAARFQRKQLDANRPASGAYESNKAKLYYDGYHEALQAYCTEVRKSWGRGLLIDLHGQGTKADTIFRGTRNLKTVSALKDRFGMAAITGPESLLGAMHKLGYKSFPAPADEPQTKENPRFNGGYIVATYGSDAGTGIDAIQLELGSQHRSAAGRSQFAQDLTLALKKFHTAYLPLEKLPGK